MSKLNLFDDYKIIYLPASHNESCKIRGIACYRGFKIKTTTGVFIDQKSMTFEKVVRYEVDAPEDGWNEILKEKRKNKLISIRNKDILKRYEQGASVSKLAKIFKLSRPGIYNILKKE